MSEDPKRNIAYATIEALDGVMRVAASRFYDHEGLNSSMMWAKPIELIDEILHAVVAIADEIRKGLDGSVSAEAIENSISAIRDKLAKNDQAIDLAIDAKFPKGDGIPP